MRQSEIWVGEAEESGKVVSMMCQMSSDNILEDWKRILLNTSLSFLIQLSNNLTAAEYKLIKWKILETEQLIYVQRKADKAKKMEYLCMEEHQDDLTFQGSSQLRARGLGSLPLLSAELKD